MYRTGLFALPMLLAALVEPAVADDRDLCNDAKAGRESRLAACSNAIASRQWSGADLARLHVSRAEQYTYSRQRALDKALEDCNAAIAIDPKLAAAYRWRGVVYYERKDYDLAIAEQDRALVLNPRFAGAYYDRGRAFAGKHDQARALADYDEAIKINPKYAAPYNGRGLVHYQGGQLDAAIADFSEAITLDPKYTAPLYNRSRAFAHKRELDLALADADASLRIDPQYLSGHIRRGYVLKEMRNFDGALTAFNRAAEVDPKSPRPAVGRGEVLVDRKDYRRAIAEFDAAIRLDPSHAPAYSQRGFAYYKTGDLDQALKDVNEAFKHDSKSAGSYNVRGLVQHAKHDYDEAIADLTQAIRLEPLLSNFYSNRGRTYNARKEFDRAILDLNESIRLNPANPLPYWHRAISYENKRERDKALADWRTTLRLEPDNQNAIKAIRRLEQEKTAPSTAGKTRVALVIGNSDYKYGSRLPNPVNDASDFANTLRKLGFDVIEGRNLDKRGMDEKIAEFARKLDKAGIGLFFYAGHGIQVDGDNWLIPTDARIEPGDLREGRSANVKTATVNVAQILAKMEAEQRVNLIFLDACRDNPFGRGSGGLAQPKGLAPIQNAVGTLTAFATKPYHVALDGDGRNSPFTTALLKHMPTPGLEIGGVMKRVRVDVIKSTGGEQVPFDESSLITDVVLAQ
jgi:tetratricopeptide (TPR) repeat protein